MHELFDNTKVGVVLEKENGPPPPLQNLTKLYKLDGNLFHYLGHNLKVDGPKNIQFNCTLGVITR